MFFRLCVRRCTPVAGNSSLKRRSCPYAVFMVVVVRKTASSEYILQRAKEMGVRGGWMLNRNSREDDSSSCLAETFEFGVAI